MSSELGIYHQWKIVLKKAVAGGFIVSEHDGHHRTGLHPIPPALELSPKQLIETGIFRAIVFSPGFLEAITDNLIRIESEHLRKMTDAELVHCLFHLIKD